MEILEEFRKVQGIMGSHSFSIILPKRYATEIGISKGTYVKVRKVDGKLVIEKIPEGPQA